MKKNLRKITPKKESRRGSKNSISRYIPRMKVCSELHDYIEENCSDMWRLNQDHSLLFIKDANE